MKIIVIQRNHTSKTQGDGASYASMQHSHSHCTCLLIPKNFTRHEHKLFYHMK